MYICFPIKFWMIVIIVNLQREKVLFSHSKSSQHEMCYVKDHGITVAALKAPKKTMKMH